MLSYLQLKRFIKIIENNVRRLELNLSGYTVVTECATGIYSCTPIIALLAGAERVVAYGQDSKFGSFFSAKKDLLALAHSSNVTINNLTLTNREGELKSWLRKADIITNSGHLRPLDKQKLSNLKRNAVVSLMYEHWELRETDIDLSYCKEKSIKVAGTNERHRDLCIFDYLGPLLVKTLLNANLEVVNNKFLLICDNDFKDYIAKTLLSFGAEVYYYPDFALTDLDGIIFAHTPYSCGGHLTINYNLLPKDVFICVQVWGDVNRRFFNSTWLPETEPTKGHMGIYLSDLGFETVVRLQTGGLKVGELLLTDKTDSDGKELAQII